jgi:two-component sensor histidine kinase
VSGVRRIEIECLANPTPINADKALALGLIANELVTNSLKYSFSEEKQGTVSVVLDRDEKGLLRLAVRDDGSGCPEDASPGLGTSIVDAW